MDPRQKILPFRRFVVLPNGQQASVLPTKLPPCSGFSCSICNLSFKTKQALCGHNTSALHQRRLPAVPACPAPAPAQPLVFAVSPCTPIAVETTPFELGPTTASSSTSSPARSSSDSNISEVIPTVSRKMSYHVKLTRPKLTRGASKRCKWSLLTQAEILEDICQSIHDQRPTRFLEVAQKFGVPVGNISRWWKTRAAIFKRAEELRQRMLLGLRQRQRADQSTSLKIHWSYNQTLRPLLKHLELQILNRQKTKRPVTLGFVKRVCAQKVKQLTEIGHAPTFRGQPLTASPTWCWRVMVTLGYTSRRRSKIRPTSVEAFFVQQKNVMFCLNNTFDCHRF